MGARLSDGAAANAAGIFRYFAGLAPWLEAEDVRPFPNGAGPNRNGRTRRIVRSWVEAVGCLCEPGKNSPRR